MGLYRGAAARAVWWTTAVIAVTDCAWVSMSERMRLADSWTSVTVSRIEALVSTVEWVADWIAAILAAISSVARAVWLARRFPSWATTENPRPAYTASAASIVA